MTTRKIQSILRFYLIYLVNSGLQGVVYKNLLSPVKYTKNRSCYGIPDFNKYKRGCFQCHYPTQKMGKKCMKLIAMMMVTRSPSVNSYCQTSGSVCHNWSILTSIMKPSWGWIIRRHKRVSPPTGRVLKMKLDMFLRQNILQ